MRAAQSPYARSPESVATARAFTCDGVGCIAQIRTRLITVAQSPAALEDDCRRADVIVLRGVVPRGCGRTARSGLLLLDATHLAAGGAHALYFDAEGVRVETVAAVRGMRPWSLRQSPTATDDVTDRTPGFTSLFERFRSR